MLLRQSLEGGLQADRVERGGPELGDQPAQLHDLVVDLLDGRLAGLLERTGLLLTQRR